MLEKTVFGVWEWDLLRPHGVRAPLCWCALRTAWRLNRDHETPKLLVYDSGQDGSETGERVCTNSLVIFCDRTCFECRRLHGISAYFSLWMICTYGARGLRIKWSSHNNFLCWSCVSLIHHATVPWCEEILEFFGKISKESGFQPLKKKLHKDTSGHHPEVSELSAFFFKRGRFWFQVAAWKKTDQHFEIPSESLELYPSVSIVPWSVWPTESRRDLKAVKIWKIHGWDPYSHWSHHPMKRKEVMIWTKPPRELCAKAVNLQRSSI